MTMAATILTDDDGFEHVSVMVGEVLDALAPRDGGVYLDVTAGGAGHSSAILERAPGARVVAFDRDPLAVGIAERRLLKYGDRASVVHGSFDDVEAWLAGEGITAVDGLLADLGVSSPQLDEPERGMSFRFEGPLDMRMDPTSGETALELIERLEQDELANVIYELGGEHRSRRVARCIKQAVERGELATTTDLRRAVVRAVGPRRVGGVDPATRTFQALRIAVNREMEQLEGLLAMAPRILAPGGVAVFISFHSLEDRLVKRAFLDRGVWRRLTKKPLTPGERELADNPRSRSAKLRAAVRIDPDSPRFDSEPPEDELDSAPRFALEDE
jgi:16S rRNA (cytosine1402-N4)-methyltransferase